MGDGVQARAQRYREDTERWLAEYEPHPLLGFWRAHSEVLVPAYGEHPEVVVRFPTPEEAAEDAARWYGDGVFDSREQLIRRREALLFDYYMHLLEEARRLKREGLLLEAASSIKECIRWAELHTDFYNETHRYLLSLFPGGYRQQSPPPAPYWEAAVIYRKLGDYRREVQVLERCIAFYQVEPQPEHKEVKRLEKARQLLAKHETQ